MQTMRNQILRRIEHFEYGNAFSAKDFLDIASRTTIDVALHSLTHEGRIRRISRGLYDRPRFNAALGGQLSPDIDEAAGDSKTPEVEDRARRGVGCKSPRAFNASALEDHLSDRWPK